MRVGLFSARPLGVQVREIIERTPGVELVAVNHIANGWWGQAGEQREDDVFAAKPDLIVSCLTTHIFTPKEIERCRIINLHCAPLPRYRGCNGPAHAIINGDISYGVTLHQVDAGIDTGRILHSASFPIFREDTGRILYERAQLHAAVLFELKWRWSTYPQRQDESQARYYRRDSLTPYFDPSFTKAYTSEHMARVRRALTFPPFPCPE